MRADRIAPRSYLFAPGDSERLLPKVAHAGADAIVLDLEDAVPAERKALARSQVKLWLVNRETVSNHPEVWVRVNALTSAFWLDDLEAVVQSGLDGIRVPKAESAAHIGQLDAALSVRERTLNLQTRSIAVACTIESARGVLAAPDLAKAPRVVQLAFGEADFIADIEAAPVPEASLYARSAVVIASRAARLAPPIAPVYTKLDDPQGLRATSETARDLGFGGRSCIHPKQLDIIHQVFTPSQRSIQKARQVIEAWERSGSGAAMDGSAFVDEAVVRRARVVLARAAAYRSNLDAVPTRKEACR